METDKRIKRLHTVSRIVSAATLFLHNKITKVKGDKMKQLLRNTKKLKIATENWKKEDAGNKKNQVEYLLYEDNYLSGMRDILKAAAAQEAWIKENSNRIFVNEKRNILSFIGRRGSGKTTAMDEFCRILRSMDERETRDWWVDHTLEEEEREELHGKSFKFHILSPIDASLLEEKEDLFELILANIYRKFEDRLQNQGKGNFQSNSEIREIMDMFSEIFKMYENLRERKMRDEYGNSMVSVMHFMVGSQQIQERVSALLDKLFLLGKLKYDFEYIVVAIDDLDLNLQHGYEMLEQMQKYFSYHKILVLITLDYDQMGLICEEHFYREMSSTTRIYGKEYGEHSRVLANDYMTKIFHLSQRMYMPDMKKLSKKATILVDKKVNPEEQIPVKRFVMAKVAECMHIFYDGSGLKRHFCEPETVRDLVSYNEFLESLNLIDFDELISVEKIQGDQEKTDRNVEILRRYNQNHERFNQDITVRMVQNMLMPYQKKAFEILNARDLERRARYFVCAKRKENTIEIEDIWQHSYSYGCLLEQIYEWGRRCFEDKPFICCMMASFTSEMVREYLNYRYNPDPDRTSKYKIRLLEFLGQSFGSKWSGEAFPTVVRLVNNEAEKDYYGYAEKAQPEGLNIKIKLDALHEINEKGLEESIGKWLDAEEVVATLECIDMFFTRREGSGFEGMQYRFQLEYPVISFGKEPGGNENLDAPKGRDVSQQILIISGTGKTVNLDIMGFVAKSMDYQRERKRLQENMAEGLTRVLGEYLGYQNDIKERRRLRKIIERQVEQRSMFHKFIKKDFEYEAAFPFYNLDMAYNVYKRLRKKYAGTVRKEGELFSSILELYGYIEELLKEEQDYYGELVCCNYMKVFRRCPYIRAIRAVGRESKVPERISAAFRSMVIVADQNPDVPSQ